jgi:hypothetical protein
MSFCATVLVGLSFVVSGARDLRDARWWTTSRDAEVRQIARTRRRWGIGVMVFGIASIVAASLGFFESP